MANQDTRQEYFQRLYQASVDPFRNWVNEYEKNKRSMALALLQRAKYRKIFEPGCGNGGLSKELSRIGDEVLAVDWSSEALAAAKIYCAAKNVAFKEMNFPSEIPDATRGLCDLMVVSEVLYYFSPERLLEFFRAVPEVIEQGGEIMLIHWRGVSPDYPSNGDAVHAIFHRHPHFEMLEYHEDHQYLISSGRVL